MVVLPFVACSGGDEHPSWVKNIRQSDPSEALMEPCNTGEVRACSIKLDAREGIIACYRGTQECKNNAWSDCLNGQTLSLRDPRDLQASTSPRWYALSTPSTCQANPCDPRCQVYDEVPTEPIQSETRINPFNWVTGSIGGLPGGLASKGFNEPCSTAADCQFDTYCEAPTKGSCSHGLCVTGAALVDGCTDCTKAVCAADPSCCAQADPVSTCSHDPCATGARLVTGCHPCVTKICEAKPSCCAKNGAWDATCASMVETTCGNTCECASGQRVYGDSCYQSLTSTKTYSSGQTACQAVGTGWDYVKIDAAAENAFVASQAWGSSTNYWIGFREVKDQRWAWTVDDDDLVSWPSGPSVPYVNWSTKPTTNYSVEGASIAIGANAGKWTRRSLGRVYGQICEGPPSVMKQAASTNTWSAKCVDLVETQCGATCDDAEPTRTTGLCIPWYPGMTRESCAGVDLAVGTPCEEGIPICNHGTLTAPAGIKIAHFPANSQQYPKCSPDQTHPQMKTCLTTAPIEPGKCITVKDCPDLSGNREIVVNPEGPGYVPECICGDNWSLYSGGTCGEPICAGGNSAATAVKKPVDIVFLIDNSGSMTEEIVEVQERINEDFAEIIGSSGIDYRVIMFARYGDVYKAVGGSDHPICIGKPLGGNDCLSPSTEKLVLNPPTFYHYSADITSWNSWCQLLSTYKKSDESASDGRAWTPVAPTGWSAWMRPEALKVFVEITDDNVNCSMGGYTFNDGGVSSTGTTAAANFDRALLSLDPAQFGTSTKRNYVWHSIVGLAAKATSTEPYLSTEAMVTKKCATSVPGLGTGYQALSMLTGGLRYPVCNYTDFDAVFNAIATEVIEHSTASCEYRLPADQTTFDPQRITINYSSTQGNKEKVTALTKVASQDACTDTGWFYDDPGNPTTVKLCPAMCTTVTADTTARVIVEIGCPAVAAPITVTQVYSGNCDANSTNIWLDLAYQASIFEDGNIVYRARVAQTQAELTAAEWVSLGTATSATQVCPLSSSCALNVFELLGAQAAQSPYLELEITVNPSTIGRSPVLTEYQMTFSCIDNK